MKLFDIHAHLTHQQFVGDVERVIQNARDASVKAIIVNGLEPKSNRQILEMSERYDIVYPALGIYPVDAVNQLVGDKLPFEVAQFDVDKEISFISEMAKQGRLVAIGECGLDGHWVKEDTYQEQERVFIELMGIAMDNDLPLIIHTRSLESRAGEILAHHGAKFVDFHCFGGRTKLAQTYAEQYGWWFSIPSTSVRNGAFQKMLKTLPLEKILLETDCPYQGPVKGERNEPATVMRTLDLFSEYRNIDKAEASNILWKNFCEIMRCGGDKTKFDEI